MMLDSKIVTWLGDLTNRHNHFRFCMTTEIRNNCFVVELYDTLANTLIDKIRVPEEIVISDDLNRFRQIVEPKLPFNICNLTDEQIKNVQDEAVNQTAARLMEELDNI